MKGNTPHYNWPLSLSFSLSGLLTRMAASGAGSLRTLTGKVPRPPLNFFTHRAAHKSDVAKLHELNSLPSPRLGTECTAACGWNGGLICVGGHQTSIWSTNTSAENIVSVLERLTSSPRDVASLCAPKTRRFIFSWRRTEVERAARSFALS